MATKQDGSAAVTERSYEDFKPIINWYKEEIRVVEFNIPDFRKEHISVKLDSEGQLKISGERPLKENRWQRFSESIPVPKDSKISDFNARFSNAVLRISLPKIVTKLDQQPPVQPQPQQEASTAQTKELEAKTDIEKASTEPIDKEDQKKTSDSASAKDASTTTTTTASEKDDGNENIDGGGEAGLLMGESRFARLRRPSWVVTAAVVIITVVVIGVYVKVMLSTFSGDQDRDEL